MFSFGPHLSNLFYRVDTFFFYHFSFGSKNNVFDFCFRFFGSKKKSIFFKRQTNTNPQYNTEREIKYEATGLKDNLFYFDSGHSPMPHAPNWAPMDATSSAAILSGLRACSNSSCEQSAASCAQSTLYRYRHLQRGRCA